MRVLVGLVLAAGIAGCGSPMPAPTGAGYTLTCGPVSPDECLAKAGQMVAAARLQDATKQVVSISFTGADGDSEMVFDDGTVTRRYVN